MRARRLAWVICVLVLALSGDAAARRHGRARSRLNMPPGWRWPPTPTMVAEGRSCLRRLDELGVEWRRAPATRKVTTPIYLPAMEIGGVKLTSIWRQGPQVMDCQLALAFAERGAEVLRAAGIAELRFSGIYSYRNVAGTRILSRHALGLAIDVFEMVTDEGERLVVERDYPDARLLSVESWENESGVFRYLLTPGNDPRHHKDHFHFEARSPVEMRRLTASQ